VSGILRELSCYTKRTAVDLQRSVDHFRHAIEQEPESAEAWAGLAETYVLKGMFGATPPEEAFPAARSAAQRARGLDPSIAASYTALADVHKFYDWDWNAAEAAYREAIAVDPTYAVAHQWFSQLLAILGRHDEALAEIEAARRCDPLSISINAFISYIWLQARDYVRAIDAAQAALTLDATAPLTHSLLGRAYAAAGRSRPALRALKTAIRFAGPLPLMKAYLGAAYAQAGLPSQAEAMLDQLCGAPPNGAVAFHVAIVAAGLDDRDRALAALEDAYRARAPLMIGILRSIFAELANERRYQQLIARLRGRLLRGRAAILKCGIKRAIMEVFPGISMDPDIRFGKPCVTGTRIDFATIIGAIAAGETVETVAVEYALSIDQVRSALSYAAHVTTHLPPAVRQAS